MTKRNLLALVALGLLATQSNGNCQGFVNPGFESTSLAPDGSPGTVATSVGMPGWTAIVGGSVQSTILYNNGTLGDSSIAIIGTGNSLTPVIEGSFSAMLIAGATGNATLSQDTSVPISANSLQFAAYFQGVSSPAFDVAVNNSPISVTPLLINSEYTIYGVDVSGFAGQSVNVSFTGVSRVGMFQVAVLDSIHFSSAAVPEPSALSLFGLGLALLAWRRQRKFDNA